MAERLPASVYRAINRAMTPEFNRFAKKTYGMTGKRLLAKVAAVEGGGSIDEGTSATSYAGARGPFQFIASTRDAYRKQYGVDPWKNDVSAAKAAMIHLKGTGVRGYNPGMAEYESMVLHAKVDTTPLRTGSTRGRANSTRTVTKSIPGVDNSSMRRQIMLDYIEHDYEPDALLNLAYGLKNAQDVPGRTVTKTVRGKPAGGSVPREAGGHFGQIFEAFYDPAGKYFDSGQFVKGGIGGHSDHVHVAASPRYVVWLGKQAQKMGLHVGENPAFDPVDPVHTQGSFHYRNRAIDVSGDPRKMARFYKFVLDAARHQ